GGGLSAGVGSEASFAGAGRTADDTSQRAAYRSGEGGAGIHRQAEGLSGPFRFPARGGTGERERQGIRGLTPPARQERVVERTELVRDQTKEEVTPTGLEPVLPP